MPGHTSHSAIYAKAAAADRERHKNQENGTGEMDSNDAHDGKAKLFCACARGKIKDKKINDLFRFSLNAATNSLCDPPFLLQFSCSASAFFCWV